MKKVVLLSIFLLSSEAVLLQKKDVGVAGGDEDE